MAWNVDVLLRVVRIMGVVLTELGKLKAAMPAEEAVRTRGPDPVEEARAEIAATEAELERERQGRQQ
jgi:hypothetical protein